MEVLVNNPVQATVIFSSLLALIILVSARRRKENSGLSLEVTQELKGIAILMVVFSHISYFLVNDPRFLFPLSVAAGVGVNLFLFLSGYGLTISSGKSEDKPWRSYRRRLAKLFVPMWIVGVLAVLLDYFLLKTTYSPVYLFQSFLGYFPHANLYEDLNSPLWYFSLILFYYLIFPLFFSKKRPWLSAIIIYLISFLIIWSEPRFLDNVIHLHKIHLIAFPLGMIFAFLFAKQSLINFFQKLGERKQAIWRWLLIVASLLLAFYTIQNSNVGLKTLEELTSMITVLALVIVFSCKKISFRALYWVGLFSYEIYLLHWPIMYRYDFIYKYLPVWLATIVYLFIFIGLGWLLQRISGWITKKREKIATIK